jgi:hypothetical protein
MVGFILLAIGLVGRAQAANPPTISDQASTLDFPNTIQFSAQVRAASPIKTIQLEYGVDQRTCGTVTAVALPTFAPGTTASVQWTWDMRRSGSLPPGATFWYRWRATDADGAETLSPEQHVVWLDSEHTWKSLTKGMLTLHWYAGDQAFAQALLDSATTSLTRLGAATGVTPDHAINLYIYRNSDEMRSAVLYEPGWTGGLAYPEHRLTIIGIGPDDLAWGKRTAAHELTHVLVGNRAFTCIGSIPTWLNEGIAVYGEGGPEPSAQAQFEEAIAKNGLLSVRSLSGGFAEDSQQAGLSYTQSYSIVNFLISTYGQGPLLKVFDRLAIGDAIEPVLNDTYGFGIDELEDRWRAAIKAQPRAQAGSAPTPSPRPSPIPTIALAVAAPTARSEPPSAATPVTDIVPTELAAEQPPDPATPPPTRSLSQFSQIGLLVGSLVIGIPVIIALAVGILLFLTRKRGR